MGRISRRHALPMAFSAKFPLPAARMAQPQHTYVQYFIPIDGDSEEHPNAFLVRKPPKSLTLGDVQQVRAKTLPTLFDAAPWSTRASNRPPDTMPRFSMCSSSLSRGSTSSAPSRRSERATVSRCTVCVAATNDRTLACRASYTRWRPSLASLTCSVA